MSETKPRGYASQVAEAKHYLTEKDALDILRWGNVYSTRMTYDPSTKRLRIPTDTGVLVAKPGDHILRIKHRFTRVHHDEYESGYYQIP